MENNHKNFAIILAGGKGIRMNRSIPKQFINIDGKPLIIHTLKVFEKCVNIDGIIIVCIESHIDLMNELCKNYGINKICGIIPGGITRHESILHGLEWMQKKYKCSENFKVIIHNANMPLVTINNIDDCLMKCTCERTVITSVCVNNGYFYKICNDGNLKMGPDRATILSAKVPECAFLQTFLSLYSREKFRNKKYESYTAGMLAIISKYKVLPVYCESTNMKVTTDDDYEMVETYLKNKDI